MYSEAKRITLIIGVLVVPGVAFTSVASTAVDGLSLLATVWSCAVEIACVLVLEPASRRLQQSAARVQELFDCDVLGLEWNQALAGGKPEGELVHDYYTRYIRARKSLDDFVNWYPEAVGEVPSEYARVICQRYNSWWDAALHRRYSGYVIATMATVAVAVLAMGIVKHLALVDFLVRFAIPLSLLTMRAYRHREEHTRAHDRAESLRQHADELWEKVLSGQLDAYQLRRESRELQNRVFCHRASSPLVPDRIYNWMRPRFQANSGATAESMIAELKMRMRA